MKKQIYIFALVLLTITLSSGIPRNDEQKKEDVTTPRADDQGSIEKEDSMDVNVIEIMNECNESFVIPASYFEALSESGSFPDEADRNPKCYVRCVLEKTEILSDDGSFNPARAALVFAGEGSGKYMADVEVLATDCGKNRVEQCKCERSYQYIKCLMEMKIQRAGKSEKSN